MTSGMMLTKTKANKILAKCGCPERVQEGDTTTYFLILYTEQILKRLEDVENKLETHTSVSCESVAK